MAQQTAIEDLIIALQKFVENDGVCPDTIEAVIEFAENRKEMHKEQIVSAYKADRYPCSDEDAEEYYNKTYKQNT